MDFDTEIVVGMSSQLETITAKLAKGNNGRLYETVESFILSQIKSGRYKPSKSIGSASDLAKELNVSLSTVQQSLQTLAAKGIVVRKPRSGTFINPDISNAMASPLQSKTISLIVPDVVHPEYVMLLRAFQDSVLEFDLDVVCSSTDNVIDLYNGAIFRQIETKPFGIVIVPPFQEMLPLDTIIALEKSGIPVVCCFRSAGLSSWPIVTNDVLNESYLMTQHLCDIGCKHIAFFGVEYPSQAGFSTFHLQSHLGYIKALFDGGKTGADLFENLALDEKSQHINVSNIREFIKKHPDVDGICCVSDSTAAMVIRELERMGRRVPQDVAVIGAGNYGKYLGFETNYITTMKGLVEKLAQEACRLIQRKRGGEQLPSGLKVLVKSELSPGRSTVYNRNTGVGIPV
jgi:DNA-binding LacI/PurR family transcriptional regulator